MARMYEMNLIIRLQDRASARMRRISGDMSALARHAQAQNKLSSMQTASVREYNTQAKLRNELDNRMGGSKGWQIAAQQASLEATVMDRQRIMERYKDSNSKKAQIAAKRLESSELRQMAYEAKIVEEQDALTAAIEKSAAAEAALNAEIARQAPLLAKQAMAAQSYQKGRSLAHAGSLAFMGGAVGVGLAGLAAGSYAKFDVAATRAATQVGLVGNSVAKTKEQAQQLEKAILGLSTQFPASATDMANAAYDIFSSMKLGTTGAEQMANGLKLLKNANEAAVGGQVDLATATNTMITILNNFDPNLQNIHKNMTELFTTVRFMRGGFGDLGEAMNKLAPAAHQSGQSLLEVGSAVAQITRNIPSQAMAGTSLARLLDIFTRPDFTAGMRKFGKSFEILDPITNKLIPLHSIIGKLVALGPKGVDLNNMIKYITAYGSASGKGGTQGTMQARRALIELITNYKEYMGVLRDSTRDQKEFDKSVKALQQTSGVKWATAMNKLRVAWIQFGQAAMPILLTVLNYATRFFDRINGMGKGTKDLIAKFMVLGALLATVGGAFASALGGIMMINATRKIAGLDRSIRNIGTEAATSSTKVRLLSKALGALALYGPIAIVISLKLIGEHKIDAWLRSHHLGMFAGGEKTYTIQQAIAIKNHPKFFPGWEVDAANKFVKMNEERLVKARKAREAKALTANLAAGEKLANQIMAQDNKVTRSRIDEAKKYEAAVSSSQKKIVAWEKRLAKEKITAAQQAAKEQKTQIKSMVDNLVQEYKKLEDANKAATGNLLEGPLSGGPILSAYQQINQTLMGFGVKPIKVPVQFLMQDAQKQLENFNLWRGGLKKLSKRLPIEMVQELQAGGIAKLPEILSLADAGPGFLKQYVGVWKSTKAARDSATKADMDQTLKLWHSYGKSVAWQLVNGLISSGAEGKIRDQFTTMIKHTFAGELTKGLLDATNTAIKNWVAANPKPKMPKKSKTSGAGSSSSSSASDLFAGAAKSGYTLTPSEVDALNKYVGNWTYPYTKGLQDIGHPKKVVAPSSGKGARTTQSVKHETNIHVNVADPTGKAIVDAINPVLFSLRHKPT